MLLFLAALFLSDDWFADFGSLLKLYLFSKDGKCALFASRLVVWTLAVANTAYSHEDSGSLYALLETTNKVRRAFATVLYYFYIYIRHGRKINTKGVGGQALCFPCLMSSFRALGV